MDVVLQTHTIDPALGLFDVTKFGDASGCVARLRVCSRGFMLDRPFYFDQTGLIDFVNAIGVMDRTLTGVAELRTPYEYDYIRLELHARGVVAVTGEIHEYSEFDQRLGFGFETDQTILAHLVCDLGAVVDLAPN